MSFRWPERIAGLEELTSTADRAVMEQTPLLLSFVLAVVVGYFCGRLVGFLEQNDRRID